MPKNRNPKTHKRVIVKNRIGSRKSGRPATAMSIPDLLGVVTTATSGRDRRKAANELHRRTTS